MKNKATKRGFVGIEEGTNSYYLHKSSSQQRKFVESEIKITSSTENLNRSEPTHTTFQTSKPTSISGSFLLDTGVMEYIVRAKAETRESIVLQYENEIRLIIRQDDFIDGEISESECYMLNARESGNLDFIVEALMNVYSSNLGDPHMLEGILTMISSVPYEDVAPRGQIMAMGLLTNKTLSVRDKAIQCFEKWNSKKGLDYLKNIDCSPNWLQRYVEKVIIYIERDGTE